MNYFRKAPLDAAEMVLDFCKAAVADRKAAGAKIRQARVPPKETLTAAPAKRVIPPKRRKRRKNRANGAEPGGVGDLPLQDSTDDSVEQVLGSARG